MNELDQIALQHSTVCLANIPGVTVQCDWQRINTRSIWTIRLCLTLQGAKPNQYVNQDTEWAVIVNFETDPWGHVQVHPVAGEQGLSVTFEHQQYNGALHPELGCRTGFICTGTWLQNVAQSRNANLAEPSSTIERIGWHVQRAHEWLTAAANGTLTQAGDPFELPDFVTRPQERMATLAYYEDDASFLTWQQHKSYGLVDYAQSGSTLMPLRYLDHRGTSLLYEPAWGYYVQQLPTVQKGVWIRLNSVPVAAPWQAPRTWQDLVEAAHQQGIDLPTICEKAMANLPGQQALILMLGMPIPRRIGDPPDQLHWQGLELLPATAKANMRARINGAVNRLRSQHEIKWLLSAGNWRPDDLQSRGRLASGLRSANIVLLGAGSLGSTLAEQLVRMGVRQLTIVDADYLEAGNLVRHTLSVESLYEPKALALAKRLNSVMPTATVKGAAINFPDPGLSEALAAATLLIDATATDTVLKEAPFDGLAAHVPVVSCSLGLFADRLFFYTAPNSALNWQSFDEWFRPLRNDEHLKATAAGIDLPRGAGCWHTLVPARLNRISGLAGMAVELIEQVYEQPATGPAMGVYLWPHPTLINELEHVQ